MRWFPGHAKLQRLQAQVGVFQDDMGREVAQRQRAAMLNFTSFEAHIRIHHVPFVGFEAVIGQHFTRRLNVLFNLFRLRAFARIYANQRTKIGQTQLAGFNVPSSFGRGLPVV